MACCEKGCGRCPEMAAFLYGILSSIITALGALSCIGLLIYVVIDLLSEDPTISTDFLTLYLYTGILAILAVLCIIAFVFCVYLLKGIKRQDPDYLRAYFVFGVIEILLLISGCAIYTGLTLDFLEGGIALGVCVLYSLPLAAVWGTYKKFGNLPAYQQCDRL